MAEGDAIKQHFKVAPGQRVKCHGCCHASQQRQAITASGNTLGASRDNGVSESILLYQVFHTIWPQRFLEHELCDLTDLLRRRLGGGVFLIEVGLLQALDGCRGIRLAEASVSPCADG